MLAGTCILAAAHATGAPSVTLAWDANPEPDIAGYELSYGESPGNYSSVVNAGNNTTAAVSGLTEGKTYYFAVSAYNSEGLKSPPSQEISYAFVVVPTGNLSLHYVDSEDPNGYLAEYAFDGNPNTFWHTEWRTNAPPPPHELQIDLGSIQNLRGFRYLPRQDAYDSGNISQYEFHVSIDGVSWGAAVATGYFPNTKEEKEVLFNSKGGRYIKLVALSEANGGPITNVAELTLLQADNPPTGVTNTAPSAIAQNRSTAEDNPLEIILTGTDAETAALGYTVVTTPRNGTLTGTAPNLTYLPAAGFSGADSFTFRVNDGTQDSTVATVSITITPVNDAPRAIAGTLITLEDTTATVVLTGSDEDSNNLTFRVESGPSNGTLTGTPPNLNYSPAKNFNGSDQFTFRVNDGTLDSLLATISIAVSASNDVPVALAGNHTTAEDTPLAIVIGGTDPEGANLSFTVVTGPTQGSLAGTPPNVTYSPAANFNGSDSFTFMVNDGVSNSPPATVSLTVTPVNDVPVATPKSLTTPEDTAVEVVLAGTDKDLNNLTYSVMAAPLNGVLTGTAPNLSYRPAANFTGSDQFTFRVNDGTVNSTAATVSISVSAVNDVPVALGTSLTTLEDIPVEVTLGGTDAENSPLTLTIVYGPTKGTLSGTAPNLTYSPTRNSNGSDSFTYRVNDGALNSQPATVSLIVTPVNDAPIANSLSVETPAGSPRAVVLTGSDPDGSALTFTVVGSPVKGILSGTAPDLTYLPNEGATGNDQFTFRISDGSLISSLATVTINITTTTTVVKNLAPVFATDPISLSGNEGAPFSGQLSATDPGAGDVLTISKISGPAWLAISSSGTLSGTPLASNAGSNNFVVRVTDNGGAFAEAALNITINALATEGNVDSSETTVNQGPAFVGNPVFAGEASENAPYTGQSLAGKAIDSDPGDTITYWKVGGPEWLNIDRNGQLSGTPPPGSAGTNSFHIRAADRALATMDTELRIYVAGLPLPWRSSDLGIGQLGGFVSFLNGAYTQTGSGALGGMSDKTRFTYQTLGGDGSITAQVSLNQNSGPASYSGIMIRESMAPKAREVFLGLGNDSSYRLVSRLQAGRRASIKGFASDPGSATWVRLTRNIKKSMIYAHKSTDGTNWTYLGGVKITMPGTCHIGLAVSSGSDYSQTVANFSSVWVDP